MARVTLTTICKETGLSKFAVSRALAGKSGVSDDTRRHIIETAARLGYRRTEAKAKTRRLAIVFHGIERVHSELHLLVQAGIQREAVRLAFETSTHWTHSIADLKAVAKNSAGIVLIGPHGPDTLEALSAASGPVVRFGWIDPLDPIDQVASSDHEAGAAVAQYLLRLGHRSIAYVFGDPGYRGRLERYFGMREVLEGREGVVFHPMRFEPESEFPAHYAKLSAGGSPPTALFCAHDGLAVTVTSALIGLGKRVPEDVSVVGFGDFAAATQMSPSLTTVHTHADRMGAACVRLIEDRLNKRIESGIHVRVQIASRIVERQSSGPPRLAAGRTKGGASATRSRPVRGQRRSRSSS